MHAPPVDLALERLRRLPQHPSDVFELAVMRMPSWIVGEAEAPYRPHLNVAISRERRLAADGQMLKPADVAHSNPLDAVAKLAVHQALGYRPAGIVVRDAALATSLRERLAPLGIAVELVSTLPKVDGFASDMARGIHRRAPRKGYLDGANVTLERMRAFAEAAAEFHRAAPWCHLADYDLVRVESSAPTRELSCFVVLGGGGHEYGLGFFASAAAYKAFSEAEGPDAPVLSRRYWSLTFDPLHELPIADGDLWADHALAVAGERAYPYLALMSRGGVPERADAEQLTYVEGLLRSLATTTEDELDSGRWRKRVDASDGEREYTMALPDVLKPRPMRNAMPDRRTMEGIMADLHAALEMQGLSDPAEINKYLESVGGKIPHAPATTPRERAAEKCRQALDHHGRYRTKLAREAIALWPDYADSWVLLAEDMPDLSRARELWQHALEAATRDLGLDPFTEHVGHFWGVLETRPYMRVRAGLARVEWALGNHDAALEHWRDMLRLNPRDNQGIRMLLLPRLLGLGRDDDTTQVLTQYMDDTTAMLEFARALLLFRRHGAGALADAGLTLAQRANRHVLKHLLDDAPPGGAHRDGTFSFGDEREAEMVGTELWPAYRATVGAREWLREKRREWKQSRKKSKPRR